MIITMTMRKKAKKKKKKKKNKKLTKNSSRASRQKALARRLRVEMIPCNHDLPPCYEQQYDIPVNFLVKCHIERLYCSISTY